MKIAIGYLFYRLFSSDLRMLTAGEIVLIVGAVVGLVFLGSLVIGLLEKNKK